MNNMSTHMRTVFKDAFDRLRNGELRTLIPFLSLFRLNGKPMNLRLHYQFSPMFDCVQASNTVFMCGRQLGKSYSICADMILRAMLIPAYHTLVVQPRADQIQRLINTVYRPLLESCPIMTSFITSAESQKLALRQYRNGSLAYADHSFADKASRLRGISGCASTTWDECQLYRAVILVVENSSTKCKRICDIKAGDVCISFANDVHNAILNSVVVRDASFRGVRACFRITTAGGRTVECTEGHALQTNYGRLRLSEIIEHEHRRRSEKLRTGRDPDQCNHGEPDGGRESGRGGPAHEIHTVEPRRVPDGLCADEVPVIVRGRYTSTADQAESRLREELGRPDTEEPWGVSLVVCPDASGRLQPEDRDAGVPRPDHTSHSAGLVVHGRRDACKGGQPRDAPDQRVQPPGAASADQLAVAEMGHRGEPSPTGELVFGEGVVGAVAAGGRVPQAGGADRAACPGLHEIQDRAREEDVRLVREGIHGEPDVGLLLGRVPGGMPEAAEARLPGAEQGAAHPEIPGVESRAQGPREPAEQGGLCGHAGGAEAEALAGGHGVSQAAPGGREGRQAALQGGPQGRSGIPGEAEAAAGGIVPAKEGRSGEARQDAGEQAQSPCGGQAGAAGPAGLLKPEPAAFYYDPVVSVEYIGDEPVYDIEVTGTHNYIMANGVCSYNCQDIDYEAIDIGNETMSASLFWGFARYTGTPKTTDTTLALLWARSSQAEWVIQCKHCGYFNVPNAEHDLLKMVGKSGPVCAKCGKPVYPHNGGYVHAFPDRMHKFPGYHVSQTIHPLHMINQGKWNKLLDKLEHYGELELYNEVFGLPYDAATSPLTMSDLQKATHGIKVESVQDFEKVMDQYSYVTVAVDWSGGGMISDSYTSYAVMGLRRGSDIIDVLYGRRMPKGMTPTEEARELLTWIAGTGADAFAYDNGGAGFARLEIMNHEGLRNIPDLTIVPINYVRPHAGDVMVPRTGQREADLYYYTLDKSRSLAICIMSLKACRLRLPAFDETDESAYQRDLLALREDPRVSLGNETVILIIKKPGVPDDFAHAVNFGASQIWDHFGAYPRIGTRYDASVLDFDENHEPILDDEKFGPRGDFDRFRDAVEQKADVVEPDEWWT